MIISAHRQSKMLRGATWSVVTVFLLCTLVVLSPAHRASASTSPKVLLALGDSLAAGYEPTFGTSLPPINPSSGYRDHGYPGSYAADLASTRGLRLVDLGCPGETTASMLGIPAQRQCARLYATEFAAQSQLVAAETFLSRHAGQVALVTIDIGVNNLLHCVSASQVNPTCLQMNDVSTQRNLAGILRSLLASLRRADPRARVIAMNYYDPFLGLMYSPGGTQGVKLALGSLVATNVFNRELANTYRTFAVAVANTASAFHMNAPLPLAHYGGKTLPTDVVSTCKLTWMCPVRSQRSRDIHPNLTGYRAIASAFEQKLGS
ncbi:MAG TPA: SGNH/GDSL hydrolase family protein [Acidimicrobiales bacterium]|nr:SGNH/GDSL hydrolase family protein [Acidimicrobiales bacterium]